MAHARIQTDLEVSFRQNPAGDFCCYATAVTTTPRGQRQILASEHMAARDPEKLLDHALVWLRQHATEEWLNLTEPF
jgi:hypothetical protein